ncbi:hypothetical protein PFICI_01683 [Pestalotiopsis fici W106-1]|uniref:NADH:flavin oxidoreductase/NADH oxidase N-terminal domain-containing protein n=1 Tax=Pestalotiopsis fici (strain W106-1 / CGMCC3.15140) TaxID=1229662 RepID=W3XPG9_PESFW|nr:uncharacterized protein PFICI_01683 [Pestalotiopsis fici W106-1]ETS87855.1 hypothetical protein PFICI_01683 [Pestalotiopsis fici W106-1]
MYPNRVPSKDTDSSPLAEPLRLEPSGKVAKNRLLKAAMTEQLSTWDPVKHEKRGIPTPELVNLYTRFGEGGFGLVLTGNIMFEYDHLEGAGNVIIPPGAPFSGERFGLLKRVAEAAKKHGSLVIAQLSHPGRQVAMNIQPNPISASDVQLKTNEMGMESGVPRPMEEADFARIIEGFAHATEYCYRAGFDGIQLHAAHGYLLAQFLSPSTNKRSDQYGGPLLNRSRLIFEIAAEIRKRIPTSFAMGIKLNSVEFQEDGFSVADCKQLCAEIEKHKFDFVELSGGTYEELGFSHKRESTKQREAFFLEFAEKVKINLNKTKIFVTGGLRTVDAMVRALDTVDGVGLGRPVSHESDLAEKILNRGVKSAIEPLLDSQDFFMTAVAAGAQ